MLLPTTTDFTSINSLTNDVQHKWRVLCMYVDWQTQGKHVTPCLKQVSALRSHPQKAQSQGWNGLENLYIPTYSLAICLSVIDDMNQAQTLVLNAKW